MGHTVFYPEFGDHALILPKPFTSPNRKCFHDVHSQLFSEVTKIIEKGLSLTMLRFMTIQWRFLLLALCGLWLAGCGSENAAKEGDGTLRIAVIPKGTTHEFWRSIHAGAVKAEKELNAEGKKIEVIWKGPLKEDDRDQQISLVQNFTTSGVDGIVLAPLDAQALVSPVEIAQSAGIPVVIIDSGLNTDKYVSFVATDNLKGGQMAGEYLANQLKNEGKVILLRYAVGSASTEKRENGFLSALEKSPNIQLISSDQYAGPTRETAYQNSQNLLNRFGQEVNAIFCVNENSTIGMTKALREIGRAGGEVKMIGFDAGSQSIKDMESGDVQGLVVQDPVRMGYEGVKTIVAHIEGKQVEKRIDTGVVMITPENLNDEESQRLLNPPIDEYLGE
jgi:ribose transport system substrate-binding protein